MSHAMLLPPEAWRANGTLAEARFVAPGAGRLCVWAEGGDADTVLHRADGAAIRFEVLGGSAFAGCEVADQEPLRVTAPAPRRRCLVLLRGAGAASASLSAFPRAVSAPPRRAAEDMAATRAAMDAALAAQDLDGALAALAELLVMAREDDATQQAAAALLRHLAAHPMLRGAALGALAAALTEVPA